MGASASGRASPRQACAPYSAEASRRGWKAAAYVTQSLPGLLHLACGMIQSPDAGRNASPLTDSPPQAYAEQYITDGLLSGVVTSRSSMAIQVQLSSAPHRSISRPASGACVLHACAPPSTSLQSASRPATSSPRRHQHHTTATRQMTHRYGCACRHHPPLPCSGART